MLTAAGRTELSLATVDVVIVTYKSLPLVRRCLDSILRYPPETAAATIHVVDNASGDGTPEAIASEFPMVRVLRRTSNDGFAVANNMVLANSSASYILVLNPDTELRDGVVDHVLKQLRENPRIGIVGCRLEQLDGSFDHAAKRTFPSPGDAIRYFAYKHGAKTVPRYLSPGVDEFGVGDVDAVNGAFMMVRGSAMKDVGVFDEAYWMYGEDLDLCRRFRLKGWDIRYDGRVTAIHVKGGTSNKSRPLKLNWHFHRSMARFYRKFDGGHNIVFDGLVYFGIFGRFALTEAVSTIARTGRKVYAS